MMLAADSSGVVTSHGLTSNMLGGRDWHHNGATGAGQGGVEDGVGLNNIGLLVRVWGKVTQRDTTGLTYFYIDDGSGILDGTQTASTDNVGVRVIADPTPYSPGDYVTITGISSCFKDGSGNLQRKLLPVP